MLCNSRKFSNIVAYGNVERENGYNELNKFKGVVWRFLLLIVNLTGGSASVTAFVPQNSYADAQCEGVRTWGGAWKHLSLNSGALKNRISAFKRDHAELPSPFPP